MFGRRDFVTGVLVIYLLLIILFFAYKEPETFSVACTHRRSCIRFCCDDHATCSNEFISEHFNDSLVLDDDNEYADEVKHIFGRPGCSTLKPFEAHRQWQFHYDGSVENLDNSNGPFFSYDVDEYCLEAKNNTDKDSIDWEVKYCDYNTRAIVHVILGSASVVVIIATMIVYVMSSLLRTAAEKCELMLLLGLFLIQLGYTWIHHGVDGIIDGIMLFLIFGGLLLTYFWTCVLTFDIWRSFKYQKASEDEMKKFLRYCYFVFGTIVTLIVLSALGDCSRGNMRDLMKYTLGTLYLCFLIMAVVDIILLLQTSYMVFQLSKAARSTDHSWFEAEKQRFWKYSAVYFVMLIIWPIEIYSMLLYTSVGSRNITDIIKLFSTVVIFVAFAWKNLLEISGGSHTLSNSLLQSNC